MLHILARTVLLASLALVWAPIAERPAVQTASAQSEPLGVDGPAAAAQLLDLVNAYRAASGVGPVELSDVAAGVALDRTLNMVECHLCSFDHQIPETGFAPNWEITQIHGAIGAGENLGITDATNDEFVQSLFDSWVASPTHNENLLRPQWTHMGLGIVEIPLRGGTSEKVVTQLFVMAAGPLTRA
jgi:uncharacterized protein YkwD